MDKQSTSSKDKEIEIEMKTEISITGRLSGKELRILAPLADEEYVEANGKLGYVFSVLDPDDDIYGGDFVTIGIGELEFVITTEDLLKMADKIKAHRKAIGFRGNDPSANWVRLYNEGEI